MWNSGPLVLWLPALGTGSAWGFTRGTRLTQLIFLMCIEFLWMSPRLVLRSGIEIEGIIY